MTWDPIQVETAGGWGKLQLLFGTTDVTYFRDVPAQIENWTNQEPFGDSVMVVTFPQVTLFENANNTEGSGPDWLFNGQKVTLKVIRPNGDHDTLWAGLQLSTEDVQSGNSLALQVHCIGALFQADLGQRQPKPFSGIERDIGTAISKALNAYQSDDYGHCNEVVTGITTRQRGGWTPILTGYVQDLLSTATTDDGTGQWTVKQVGRTPVIALKDTDNIHATLACGAPGVTPQLVHDVSVDTKVIYGEGTAPDGGRWRNSKYPNFRADDAPVFPGGTFSPGDGDPGFEPFADELREHGYIMHSNNTYDTRDEKEVRDAQEQAGITVDGIVGPQTWAAVFEVGSNVGDLEGAYCAPLASLKAVEQYLYNPATGAIIGDNPDYDPTRLRVERKVDYGEGVTKQDATRSARAEIHRYIGPGYFGTITLKTDPQERSRFDLRSGMNVLLKNHRGANRTLHIAQVSVDWPSLTVTLTVDNQFRDLMSIVSIHKRNKEANQDPARRISSQRRKSRQSNDTTVVFDSESGAGVIPKHGLQGGLWTVIRIPAGHVGTIAKTEIHTISPVSTFAVGVFAKPITANRLATLVGNPLASNSAWDVNADVLLDEGLVMAWGDSESAAGYFPRQQSDDDAEVTGRLVDDASWEYWSDHPPWLWIAEYSPDTCYIRGRLYPAPDY